MTNALRAISVKRRHYRAFEYRDGLDRPGEEERVWHDSPEHLAEIIADMGEYGGVTVDRWKFIKRLSRTMAAVQLLALEDLGLIEQVIVYNGKTYTPTWFLRGRAKLEVIRGGRKPEKAAPTKPNPPTPTKPAA